MLLEVENLTKRFGGLTAVNDLSFGVEEKAILSVIGPNGAGKSTLFKLITSFERPNRGRVRFNGENDHVSRAARGGAQGRGADVSGKHDLQGDDRHRNGHPRASPALPRQHPRHGRGQRRVASGRSDISPFRRGNPRTPGHDRRGAGAGDEPATRLSARAGHRGSRWPPSPRSCSWTSPLPASTPKRPNAA